VSFWMIMKKICLAVIISMSFLQIQTAVQGIDMRSRTSVFGNNVRNVYVGSLSPIALGKLFYMIMMSRFYLEFCKPFGNDMSKIIRVLECEPEAVAKVFKQSARTVVTDRKFWLTFALHYILGIGMRRCIGYSAGERDFEPKLASPKLAKLALCIVVPYVQGRLTDKICKYAGGGKGRKGFTKNPHLYDMFVFPCMGACLTFLAIQTLQVRDQHAVPCTCFALSSLYIIPIILAGLTYKICAECAGAIVARVDRKMGRGGEAQAAPPGEIPHQGKECCRIGRFKGGNSAENGNRS